jgi:hypothetical protein
MRTKKANQQKSTTPPPPPASDHATRSGGPQPTSVKNFITHLLSAGRFRALVSLTFAYIIRILLLFSAPRLTSCSLTTLRCPWLLPSCALAQPQPQPCHSHPCTYAPSHPHCGLALPPRRYQSATVPFCLQSLCQLHALLCCPPAPLFCCATSVCYPIALPPVLFCPPRALLCSLVTLLCCPVVLLPHCSARPMPCRPIVLLPHRSARPALCHRIALPPVLCSALSPRRSALLCHSAHLMLYSVASSLCSATPSFCYPVALPAPCIPVWWEKFVMAVEVRCGRPALNETVLESIRCSSVGVGHMRHCEKHGRVADNFRIEPCPATDNGPGKRMILLIMALYALSMACWRCVRGSRMMGWQSWEVKCKPPSLAQATLIHAHSVIHARPPVPTQLAVSAPSSHFCLHH